MLTIVKWHVHIKLNPCNIKVKHSATNRSLTIEVTKTWIKWPEFIIDRFKERQTFIFKINLLSRNVSFFKKSQYWPTTILSKYYKMNEGQQYYRYDHVVYGVITWFIGIVTVHLHLFHWIWHSGKPTQHSMSISMSSEMLDWFKHCQSLLMKKKMMLF